MDRGPGPLVLVKHADVVFGDAVTGDNSNAGGYGLSMRDNAYCEGPNGFALTGNGTADARVYLGKKGLKALPAAGSVKNDLPAAAVTAADEELVAFRRRS